MPEVVGGVSGSKMAGLSSAFDTQDVISVQERIVLRALRESQSGVAFGEECLVIWYPPFCSNGVLKKQDSSLGGTSPRCRRGSRAPALLGIRCRKSMGFTKK